MASDQPTERRKHVRRPALIQCRIDGAATQAAMRLTDVSAGGCFVATTATVLPDARITLRAMMSGEEVSLTGHVVHVQPGRGFGFAIDIDELTEDARQRLQEFLSQPR